MPSHTPSYRAVLDQYCVTCHNQTARTAELLLDQADVENIDQGPEVWEKVLKKLRAGAMPPAGMPRPNQATYDSFATYLETALDSAAAAHPNPGRPVMHRLNRVEYTNAVRDLLAVDIDGETLLPADDSRYGFDNIGDVLTVSPALLERYLSAARKISRLAIGDPDISSVFEGYTIPKYFMQDDRMNEDLPFGSRGGMAVRHNFPLDGEYLLKVRLERNSRDYIKGLQDRPHQLDVRLNGARLELFTIGWEKHGRSSPIFSNNAMGERAQDIYERTADEILEVRFPATAGPQQIEVAFLKETSMPEGPLRTPMSKYDLHNYKGGDPGVASVSITGPYNAKGIGETPSRRKVFLCRPNTVQEEEPCATKILSTLARRAYRQSLTEINIQTLLDFYKAGHNEGGFEAGIGSALERILVGPEFLFRIEADPENAVPNTAYRISDLDLASRLSFFLWSSIPDDQLLENAERGRLQDPVVLEQEVRRLLKDPRSKALVSNFAAQWLQLRSLRAINPDQDVFPYFEENLREAFRQETELFFESLLREDRGVLELLSADYTFLRTAGSPLWYSRCLRQPLPARGIKNGRADRIAGQRECPGGHFLRQPDVCGTARQVGAGKHTGTPPPPPPPNVPDLAVSAKDGKALSMREAMEQHRANPVCATCHKIMDPLGFAMENFDGIGTWRTRDAGAPIDPSGILPDGTPFVGPAELQRVLIETKSAEFIATATERLLTYALGRGVEAYDAPAIRSIIREAAPDNYRWSSLILGIVKCLPSAKVGQIRTES